MIEDVKRCSPRNCHWSQETVSVSFLFLSRGESLGVSHKEEKENNTPMTGILLKERKKQRSLEEDPREQRMGI